MITFRDVLKPFPDGTVGADGRDVASLPSHELGYVTGTEGQARRDPRSLPA